MAKTKQQYQPFFPLCDDNEDWPDDRDWEIFLGKVWGIGIDKVLDTSFEDNYIEEHLKFISNLEWKRVNILGEYLIKKREIRYYQIESAKEKEVVSIHERYHALHHLMPGGNSANDRTWRNYSSVSSL